MNASPSIIPTEQDRMNILSSWWGLPNTINAGDMESRVKKFQALKGDINRLLQEASSRQTEALKAANERSIGYFQDFFAARQPFELMKAQSNIVRGFMESLADQTKSWLDLTQRLQDRGSAVVREMAAQTALALDTAAEEETFVEAEAEAEDYANHSVLFDEELESDEPVDKQTVRSLLKADTGKRPASKSRSVSRAAKR